MCRPPGIIATGGFPSDLRIVTGQLALFRTKIDEWAIKSVLLPLKSIEL